MHIQTTIVHTTSIQLEKLPVPMQNLLTVKTLPTPCHAFSLFQQKKIAGILVFREIPPDMEILDFVVIQKKQNQRLGTKLLEKLVVYAREKAYKNIWLEVNQSNFHAQHLYANYGFRNIGRRKNYYGTDDAITMVKIIE